MQKQKPGAHVLVMMADLMPKFAFNHYGAADSMIAKDRDLLRDTIARDDRGATARSIATRTR